MLEGARADALVKDLPQDLPNFVERFGTDAQCQAYLVRPRWPDGFHCPAWSYHRQPW